MDGDVFEKQFARIGARVRVRTAEQGTLALDVKRDAKGQFFDLAVREGVGARVVDVDEELRHVLVLGINVDPAAGKRRFLCGHDEREWFACAVPGRSVSNVRQAMEALKPPVVRLLQERAGVRGSARLKRRTAAYVRQGEWFFVPRPDVVAEDRLVLKNEPLSRGNGSKPHWAELVYRTGGRSVMVCARFPQGLEYEQYHNLLKMRPKAKNWNWRPMLADASVYVKGRVSHPDHATVRLGVWHQVLMNTEREAPGVRNVVFLD